MWRGFSILRENYATVIQVFRLILDDWRVMPDQLDKLYQRFMLGFTEEQAKEKLVNLCEKSSKKSMTSSEKLSFENSIQ